MTRTIAILAVSVMSIANWVCTWIFGFGVWPRSWAAVLVFGVINHVVLRKIFEVIEKEGR